MVVEVCACCHRVGGGKDICLAYLFYTLCDRPTCFEAGGDGYLTVFKENIRLLRGQ